VRCSACVQMCPTGVLSFGQVNRRGEVVAKDPGFLAASPVLMREIHVNGKKLSLA
jgi:NosR/NirI family transcriptional regulator, nitrous oxide reductase regulator